MSRPRSPFLRWRDILASIYKTGRLRVLLWQSVEDIISCIKQHNNKVINSLRKINQSSLKTINTFRTFQNSSMQHKQYMYLVWIFNFYYLDISGVNVMLLAVIMLPWKKYFFSHRKWLIMTECLNVIYHYNDRFREENKK